MLSIRRELRQGLTDTTGLDVYFVQPPIDTNLLIPLLILEEKVNSQYYRDRNSTQEIVNLSYDVSIYTNDPEQLFELMPSVDEYCFKVGLRRTYVSSDLNINNQLWCKTMTYVCKASLLEDGKVQISQ